MALLACVTHGKRDPEEISYVTNSEAYTAKTLQSRFCIFLPLYFKYSILFFYYPETQLQYSSLEVNHNEVLGKSEHLIHTPPPSFLRLPRLAYTYTFKI